MTNKITQSDIELLTAFLDRRLQAGMVLSVEARLRVDPDFAQALKDLRNLDNLLDAYEEPSSAASENLADKIVTQCRRSRTIHRIGRWFVPVAAAAAVIIATTLWIAAGNDNSNPDQTMAAGDENIDTPKVTEIAVTNLEFFRDEDVAAVLTIAVADVSDQETASGKTRQWGSVENQLRLKLRLFGDGKALAQSLKHNHQSWQKLMPHQQADICSRILAFHDLPAEKRKELLSRYSKFVKMTPQQKRSYLETANWLNKVIEQLTPAQKKQLEALTPKDRARALLQLRNELDK